MRLPDLETFKKRLSGKAKDELLIMRSNAEAKGLGNYVLAVDAELDKRFPGWNEPSKRGRARPTEVMFRGEKRGFDTEKEAYTWLIEQFIRLYPKPFEKFNWKDIVFLVKGKKRLAFARKSERLYHGSKNREGLAGNVNNHVRLSNGWHADLNLPEERKHQVLRKFSYVAELKEVEDWIWHVLDEPYPMSEEEELKMVDQILGQGVSHAV